jgi:hypothetical protein
MRLKWKHPTARKGKMRLWIGTASVIGAGLMAASPGAARPQHWTDSGSYSGDAPCVGFTNYYQGSYSDTGTTTFDKNGNPVTDVIHQSGSELNTRSGGTDNYTVIFEYTLRYDYATGTRTLSGMIIKVTYPGLGVLFHDVGQIVHLPGGVTVVHGPHDVWEQGQDAYCNAFLAIANGT